MASLFGHTLGQSSHILRAMFVAVLVRPCVGVRLGPQNEASAWVVLLRK